MRKIQLTILLAVLTIFTDCRRVPITGRRQFDFVPDQQVLSMSQSAYNDVLQQSRLANNTPQGQMVESTGRRIASAVEQYLIENDMRDDAELFEWEFNLIDDNQANAWAMPGGKIAFYTGILPITQDEDGLAVVMGHEIAHIVAKHGSERMSQALTTQLGGVALSVALRDRPQQTQQLFYAAYGLGAAVGVELPFSRRMEREADRLGLVFMARAGYDPHAAIAFWQRMEAMERGPQPPEFLSTHPSHARRIRDIERHLPEALEHYQRPVTHN
jgi:predicted Zn-dependent protease